MKITVFKSAAVPSRISGSGETGANHFPSKPALLVRGVFVLSLYFSSDISELGLQLLVVFITD